MSDHDQRSGYACRSERSMQVIRDMLGVLLSRRRIAPHHSGAVVGAGAGGDGAAPGASWPGQTPQINSLWPRDRALGSVARSDVATATSSGTVKSPFLSILKPICRNAA